MKTLSHFLVSLFCLCPCLAIDTCELTRYEEPGDIQFAVILSMRGAEVNGSCGQISYGTLQMSMAVKYAVDKLNTPDQNGSSFIPGVKIGFKLFNDCGHDKYALVSAIDAMEGEFPPEIIACSSNSTQKLFAGFIGPSRSQSAIAVSDVVTGTNIPVIGVSTTLSQLSDKAKYPNILRTVVSDNKQAQAIVSLAKSLNWTVMAILHTTERYGQDFAEAVKRLASENQVCVIHFEAVPDLRNLNRLVETLLVKQLTTKSNSLGVVFLGYREMAQSLIRILESNQINRENIAKLQWIFPDSVGTNASPFAAANILGGTDILRSVWSLSPMTINLQEFGTKVQSEINDVRSKQRESTNPWVSAFVTSMCQEHFPGPGCTSFDQNGYVPATIHAVYALIMAAKNHHSKVCSGASGMCSALKRKMSIDLLSEVRNVSFTYSDFSPEHSISALTDANVTVSFDDNGDIRQTSGQEVYSVNRYLNGKFNKVGAFNKNSNIVLTSSSPDFSRCGDGCQTCVQNPAFVYIPGDILLAGFLSIHWFPEKDTNPFGCGVFRNEVHTIISVEGFIYSIKKMNKETGLRFGAVIFDDCYNSLKADKIVSTYFSGEIPLIDPVTGDVIDLTKVVGIIGTESSAVSLPLAESFTKLNLPIVSPASTSPDYDDKGLYPYSLRTVVSDRGSVAVIIEIAKHFGWKYISIIYSNNNYGIKAAALLREKATKENICYLEPIPISVNPDERPIIDIVKTISASKAKVVVYIGLEEDIKRFQNTIEYHQLDVVYLGLEDWAVNGKPYPGTEKQTAGSLMIIPMSPRLPWDDFPEYLMSRKPVWSKTSFWFDRFWQAHFQCNLQGRFEKNYDSMCTDYLHFNLDDAKAWAGQFRVTNTINAVASMIKGIVAARNKLCLGKKEFVCETLRQKPADVTRSIKEVRLGVGSESYRPYHDDGNGNQDFTIENLQKPQSGEFSYVQVGRFHIANNRLVMDPDKTVKYYFGGKEVYNIDWSCNSPDICGACTTNTSSSAVNTVNAREYCNGDPLLRVILGVLCVVLILVLVVLVVLLMVQCRQRHKKYVLPSTAASLDFSNRLGNHVVINRTVNGGVEIAEDPYLHPSVTPNDSPDQPREGNSIGESTDTLYAVTDRQQVNLDLIDADTTPKTVHDENKSIDKRYSCMPHATADTSEDQVLEERLPGEEPPDSGYNPVISQIDTNVEQTTVKTVDGPETNGFDDTHHERYTDYNKLNNSEQEPTSPDQSSSPQQQMSDSETPDKLRPPPLPVKPSKLLRKPRQFERESTL